MLPVCEWLEEKAAEDSPEILVAHLQGASMQGFVNGAEEILAESNALPWQSQ